MKENNKDICYAKDNNGKLIKAYPMKVVADFIMLENQMKSNSEDKMVMKAGMKVRAKTEDDPLMLGKWTIVGIGETAQKMYPYLEVGMPVGIPSDIMLTNGIMHPILAHGIRDGIYDEYLEASDVFAGLHYKYATVRAGNLNTVYLKHEDLEKE